jgi:undecaprenyl-diphosphatase
MATKKQKKNNKLYFYFLIFAVLLLIALQFDFQISRYLESIRTSFLNSLMAVFTSFFLQAFLIIAASIIVYLNSKKKLLYLWLGAAVSMAVSTLLKIAVARQRPFTEGISALSPMIKDSYTTWNLSFPSNHAVFAFSVLLFLPKKWFWPGFIVAFIVAFSRVYFGLHYLSDVVAGAALGLGVSWTVKKLMAKK